MLSSPHGPSKAIDARSRLVEQTPARPAPYSPGAKAFLSRIKHRKDAAAARWAPATGMADTDALELYMAAKVLSRYRSNKAPGPYPRPPGPARPQETPSTGSLKTVLSSSINDSAFTKVSGFPFAPHGAPLCLPLVCTRAHECDARA